MKLSQFARREGVSYRTAWRWFKTGVIRGHQMPTGTIIVEETAPAPALAGRVAVYARVSAAENKSNLESQAERVSAYCAAKGWKVSEVVKEIGSGVNDHRPKLIRLLKDSSVSLIVVEHRDRLTRFGFNYIETMFAVAGRKIEVINEAAGHRDDIVQDFVAVITSFCARLYGERRSKRHTEKLIAELEAAK